MRLAILLAGASLALAAPLAAEPMPSVQIAAMTAADSFEFRGSGRTRSGFENHIWRFTPDGRVASEYAMTRLMVGAMVEQFGLKTAGTWQRAGDRICLKWEWPARRFDGCYDVLKGRGRMIYLAGPQFFEGSMVPVDPPTRAAERAPAGPQRQPSMKRDRLRLDAGD
jgi:hypothetical protein